MTTILKKMTRLLMLVCAALIWIQTASKANAESDIAQHEIERTIDSLMSDSLNRLHIPGAAVVITRGTFIFSKGYGFANLEKKMAMDPDKSVVRIGSLTKSITATAAMQLVEHEKLILNKDINTYLKTYQLLHYRNVPITLHHLLTHTAGLDQAVYAVNSASPLQVSAAEAYLQTYFRQQPPVREPGVKYEYSNAGLGLVGNLIEQRTGQTLNDYMMKHIFRPLEMPSATLELSEDNLRLAQSYTYDKESYSSVPYSYISLPGSGALNVVPSEFAHYLIMHLNGGQYMGNSVLSQNTVNMMHDRQFSAHPQMDGLGYGFFRGKLKNGIPILWATGEIDQFVSKMVLIPSEKLGIFMTVNSSDSGLELHNRVIDAIGALLRDQQDAHQQKEGEEASLQALDITMLAGNYQSGINPEHGWGKWIRFLGGFSYIVTANGADTLYLNGYFPDSEEKQMKTFHHLGGGFFQEQGGAERISFQKLNGVWSLTNSDHVTVEKVRFWQKTWMLLGFYIAFALFYIAILLIWLIRFSIRAAKKASHPISGAIVMIALLNTIFFFVQFSYGNSQLTYGYPTWYIWGVCLLPLVSAVIAVFMMIKTMSSEGRKLVVTSQVVFSLLTLLITGYLFYWNLLPVHYS